ncbi:MAG: dihydroorotate dehydrogenase-like protein [Myxococcales bacterium]|nr:dihydroorotate dehydrogenase-like protein [Myxococcales bacterium]
MKPDMSTRYLGLYLHSPVIAAPSPLTHDVDSICRLVEAGVGAVVLPSLFEEQIEHDEMEVHRLHQFGAESFPEAANYFPELDDYNTGSGRYLKLVTHAKAAAGVPVIASLNGTTRGGWVDHARAIEEAGADALELNIYHIATDPHVSGTQVEDRYVDLVRAVRAEVEIPLAVKIGPFLSSPAHVARRLVEAGAEGLVLFNRFLQPDIDLEKLEVRPDLHLSTPEELRLALRWIAILKGQVPASFAATGGPHSWEDVVKALLVGADAVMMASALLKHGPEHVRGVLDGARFWMEEKGYTGVEQMKGSMSHASCPNPAAFERSNYMKTLLGYSSRPV